MSDIFISYSRKDQAFVKRLHDALVARQREVWVDWEDIPPTADWFNKIQMGIQGARALLFILSPDSITSDICRRELAYAAANHKRLVPVVCRDVDPAQAPEDLARLNWIFLCAADNFDAGVDTLLRAIDTDFEWVDAHTALLEKALEWERKGRDKSLLLRGQELASAEAWQVKSSNMEPRPTELMGALILASRQAATRQQRTLLTSVTSALIVVLALALLFWWQSKIAKSRELAAASLNHLNLDPEVSLLLSQAAADEAHTEQAESALRQALLASHLRARFSHAKPVRRAVLSRDGIKLLTENYDVGSQEEGSISVWDVRSQKKLLQLPRPEKLQTASFSADDRLLVGVDWHGAQYTWDSSTGQAITTPQSAADKNDLPRDHQPYLSADERFLVNPAAVGQRRLQEIVSGRVFVVPADIEGQVHTVSPDGQRIVTSSMSGPTSDTTVWDASTGKRLFSLPGHGEQEEPIDCVAFSPDGRKLVTTARWIFTESGGGPAPVGDKTARIWNARTGEAEQVLRGHTRWVQSAAFSTNGQVVVTASDDGTARSWDVDTGRELAVFRGHQGGVEFAAFDQTGSSIVTASDDGSARIWDAVTGVEIPPAADAAAVFMPESPVRVEFFHEGDLQAAAVKNVDTGEVFNFKLPQDPELMAPQAVVSPDRQVLALIGGDANIMAGSDKVYLLKVRSGELLRGLEPHQGPVYVVAFSPDGKLLATGGEDPVALIWDVAAGQVRHTLAGHQDKILLLRFGPDNMLLTTSRDTTGIIWDASSGTKLAELRGHDNTIVNAVFSLDGKIVVTVCADDRTVRIWETATGKQLALLGGFPAGPRQAVFSQDGMQLFVRSGEDHVRSYDLEVNGPIQELLRVAVKRLTRQLTPAERKRYLD